MCALKKVNGTFAMKDMEGAKTVNECVLRIFVVDDLPLLAEEKNHTGISKNVQTTLASIIWNMPMWTGSHS